MTLTIQELKTEHLFSGKWITDKTIPVDKKKSPIRTGRLSWCGPWPLIC